MSLDQSPPPDDTSPGFKPDPLGSGNNRRWDGKQWTNEVEIPKGKEMSSGKKWLIGISCGLVLLIGLGAIIGEDEDKTDEPTVAKESPVSYETETDAAVADDNASADKPVEQEVDVAKPAAAEKPAKPEPVDPADEIRDALDDVPDSIYDVNVKDVYMLGNTATVELETPEGGLEGASTYDMNNMVAAVYRRIFTETDQVRPVMIQFSGGLINAKTGADLPDAITGVYVIRTPEVKQIDWDDEDTVMYGGIDWSLYRTMLHPAIKEDD